MTSPDVPQLTRHRPGRTRARVARVVPPLVVGVVGVLAWQLACTANLLPATVSAPGEILQYLWEVLRTSAAWSVIAETMKSWTIGFSITVLLGTVVGAAAGLSVTGKRLIAGLVEFFRPIPSVIFIPVVVIAFGSGRAGVILLVVLSAVWPVLIQTEAGVRDSDPLLWDVAHAYGLTRGQRIRHCVIPATVPFVATGVRIAATISLVVVITVEMLGTGSGIGAEMARALQTGDYDRLYGWAFISAALGFIVDTLLGRVENKVLRWHPSVRAEVRA